MALKGPGGQPLGAVMVPRGATTTNNGGLAREGIGIGGGIKA